MTVTKTRRQDQHHPVVVAHHTQRVPALVRRLLDFVLRATQVGTCAARVRLGGVAAPPI